jgi:hypothetical protein
MMIMVIFNGLPSKLEELGVDLVSYKVLKKGI